MNFIWWLAITLTVYFGIGILVGFISKAVKPAPTWVIIAFIACLVYAIVGF